MATYTVTAVDPNPDTWGNEHGDFHTYKLKLEGVEKVAHLNQKASTAPPVAGARLDLDLTPHPRFSDAMKAKKVIAPGGFGGGGGGRGRDPEAEARTRKSIQMQHAQKCAVDALRLAAEFGDYKPPAAAEVIAQVKLIANGLFQQIEEVAS